MAAKLIWLANTSSKWECDDGEVFWSRAVGRMTDHYGASVKRHPWDPFCGPKTAPPLSHVVQPAFPIPSWVILESNTTIFSAYSRNTVVKTLLLPSTSVNPPGSRHCSFLVNFEHFQNRPSFLQKNTTAGPGQKGGTGRRYCESRAPFLWCRRWLRWRGKKVDGTVSTTYLLQPLQKSPPRCFMKGWGQGHKWPY